jgi:hypothetical protein
MSVEDPSSQAKNLARAISENPQLLKEAIQNPSKVAQEYGLPQDEAAGLAKYARGHKRLGNSSETEIKATYQFEW